MVDWTNSEVSSTAAGVSTSEATSETTSSTVLVYSVAGVAYSDCVCGSGVASGVEAAAVYTLSSLTSVAGFVYVVWADSAWGSGTTVFTSGVAEAYCFFCDFLDY